MADEKKIEVSEPENVAAIRVGAFTDEDGDHIVVLSIGGVTFFTGADTLEKGMELARSTIEHLMRFQRSHTLTVIDHSKNGSGN